MIVADDDHATRIVCPGVDHLAVGNRIDLCASSITVNGIPILTSMPVARIIPGIFGLGAVTNKKAVAERLSRRPNRVAKSWGNNRGRRDRSRWCSGRYVPCRRRGALV